MPIDARVVVQVASFLCRLTHPPSRSEVVSILNRMGWTRRQDDSFPQGDFFQRGGLVAAVNDQEGVGFVTFNASLDEGVPDPDYVRTGAILDEVAKDTLRSLAEIEGHELEDPGEEYDEPALDYIHPYYRQLGAWVLSMGLVHFDKDNPVLLAMRMRYWEGLAKVSN